MQSFVIIFRQVPQQLTETDLKNRAAETSVWAKSQNGAGHKLEPRILGSESHWCRADGSRGPAPVTDAGPLTALLFLEANDLAQAVEIARSHPAVRYGANVEVRSWASPIVQS